MTGPDSPKVEIIPGINDADPDELIRKLTLVASHTEWVQVDISDNTLVSTTTFSDFPRLALNKDWNRALSKVKLEAHLMVNHPEQYLKDLVNCGFTRLIAHIECVDPRAFLDEALEYEIEVGLAIDADTDIEQFEPFLADIDVALVMTVDAGLSGQVFEADALEKVRAIRNEYPDLPIEIDGGVNPQTAHIAADAGATRIVTTSYIFRDPEKVEQAIETLKRSVE